MNEIKRIGLRKIINSRGESTVEVEVESKDNLGVFSSPSGASVGKYEAKSFPKGGVDRTIERIKNNKDNLIGLDPLNQQKIDQKLKEIDKTDDFSNLGGNGAIAISMAVSKLAAKIQNKSYYRYLSELTGLEPSLPLPLGNIIEGGVHAGEGATEIQEFLSIPTKIDTEQEAVLANAAIHKEVKKILKSKNKTFGGGKGDEGGWVEALNTREALKILEEAINRVEDKNSFQIKIGLDVAASEMWNGEKYRYRRDKNKDTEQQIRFIKKLSEEYPIKYFEDPLHEEDFTGFSELKKRLEEKILLCGDDLFVTNQERIKQGIGHDSTNTVLIKPNQIGTLTDTLKAINLAKNNNYITVISHRSGETTDTSIAHLAVATSEIIKCGAVNGERIAKLNELIRIEEKSNIKIANLNT